MSGKKVVLVTGATSGIGQAIAKLLSDRGFMVFGTARKPHGNNPVLGSMDLVQLDVRDDQSVCACLRTVTDRAGRIDALVNSAGYALFGSSEEISVEEAKDLFETNFFGVLRVIQVVLPIMREQRSGRIVNISSVLGFLPAPYMGIYSNHETCDRGLFRIARP